MPHGPRRFAKNTENVRHFRLIARSGHDAEIENPDSTPLVLEPFVPTGRSAKMGIDPDELMTIPESLQGLGPAIFGIDTGREHGEHQGEGSEEGDEEGAELAKLDGDCYFPKDGYNYNQHLKTMSTEKKKLGGVVLEPPKLPRDEVRVDEKTLSIQPAENDEELAVLKALEDAELYEEMEDVECDDMIGSGAVAAEVMLWGEKALDDVDLPDLAVFKAMREQMAAAAAQGEEGEEGDEEEDGEGPREEAVDAEALEELLENEYAEEEDGALDEDDEIVGGLNIEDMEDMLDEFLETQEAEKKELESLFEPQEQKLSDVPKTIAETKAICQRYYEQECEEDAETSEGETQEDESKNWDCESVLSTLSNVSNRPGKITKIKLVKKPTPGKDLGAIAETNEDAEESESDDDAVELPDVCTDRPKNETPEEKKIRKQGVKEMRRICRKMKKESKEMYKGEELKMKAKNGGSDVREKLRIMKL